MKVTVKAFLHWHKYEWEDKFSFEFWRCDMSVNGPDYVCLGEREFEVEIPDDFDPRPHQIAALREAKQRVLAEAQAKANNIDDQIQRLLCLEFKPEGATDASEM
jgi:hypothetical protein